MRDLQFLNASFLIVVILSGSVIDCKDEHPSNAHTSISVILLCITTDFKEEQPEKVYLSIFDTFLGITMDCREEHTIKNPSWQLAHQLGQSQSNEVILSGSFTIFNAPQ